jgi:hypothetical protein
MKTHIRILIVGAMLALALGAVANALNRHTPRMHLMEGDYPLYHRLADLVAESTLVVRGRVEEVRPAYRVIPEGVPLDQLPDYKRENLGYLLTDVVVRVNKVLVGAAHVADTPIVVTHLGGTQGNDRYTMEGEPLSLRDRSYLFFLQQTEDGRYVIVGGAQGRYLVRNGQFAAVSDEAKRLPLVKQLEGMAVSHFERDFDHLVKASQQAAPPIEEGEEPAAIPESLQPPANKPSSPSAGQ